MNKATNKLMVGLLVILLGMTACEPNRRPVQSQGQTGLYCANYDVEDMECEDDEMFEDDDDDNDRRRRNRNRNGFLSTPNTNSFRSTPNRNTTRSTPSRSYSGSSRSSGSRR